MSDGKLIGNTVHVTFASLGGNPIEGKVDTGATTSSLHAEDIQVNGNTVRFRCPVLSNNYIQMDLDGSQEVHSADAGGKTRPIVSLDVEIDGVPIRSASFNLNDRSGMDSPILVGQNILQPGGFIIDPSKGNSDNEQQRTADVTEKFDARRAQMILDAIKVLTENDVSLAEMLTYMQSSTTIQNKE